MASKGNKDPIYGDMIGMKYGRLTILENGKATDNIKCQCDCGTIKKVKRSSLTRGAVVSCGCHSTELLRARSTTHGLSTHYLYETWKGIRNRCLNPRHHAYKNYGAIGRTMYHEWIDDVKSFIQYVDANLGHRPNGHSIDRIDNNGNYEPGNIRWASDDIQRANQPTERSVPLGAAGFKWVKICKGRFQGSISFNNKDVHCGTFDTPEQAYEAVLAKRREMGLC